MSRQITYLVDTRVFPPNSLVLCAADVTRHVLDATGNVHANLTIWYQGILEGTRTSVFQDERRRNFDTCSISLASLPCCVGSGFLSPRRAPNIRSADHGLSVRGSGGDGAKPLSNCRRRAELGMLILTAGGAFWAWQNSGRPRSANRQQGVDQVDWCAKVGKGFAVIVEAKIVLLHDLVGPTRTRH